MDTSDDAASRSSQRAGLLSIEQQICASNACAFCSREFSKLSGFFIQCVECAGLFCGDCFCAGVEVNKHKNNHAYRIATCLEDPVFDSEWSARKELLLLQGVEKYGVGNWENIAKNYPLDKSQKQVEDHYWQGYMGEHGYCLPRRYLDENSTLHEVSELFPEPSESSCANTNGAQPCKDLYRVPVVASYQRGEVVRRETGSNRAKSAKEIEAKLMELPGRKILGYMPLRHDFEEEFANDAENMLADMDFSPDDHPSERELKLQIIRIYNRKLDERVRRKDFVVERDLVNVEAQQMRDRKMSAKDRELVNKMRVFSRFHSQQEHDALVDALLKAQRLRSQIELYKAYRQMGLSTLEEVQKFERDRKAKMKNRKNTGTEGSNEGSNALEPKSKKRGRPTKDSSAVANSTNLDESSTSSLPPNLRLGITPDHQAQIDFLRAAPGGQLLSSLELQLCVQLGYFPNHFLAVKDVLVREAYRTGVLTPAGVSHLVTVDGSQAKVICDFFVKELKIVDHATQRAQPTGEEEHS